MGTVVDFRVMELLASRLCHDLVGPIGAVSNGLELMADDSMGMQDEALELASRSARQSGHALQFYRLAYGMAGNRVGGDFGALRELILNYVSHSKAQFAWSVDAIPDGLPDEAGKLLLNLVELAVESLPRGGKITAHIGSSDVGLFLAVTAAGDRAGLRDDLRIAMDDHVEVEDLSPRNVHGFFTRQLAKRMGTDLLLNEAVDDHIQFIVAFPLAKEDEMEEAAEG